MNLDFRTKFIMTLTVATILISGAKNERTALLFFLVGLIPFVLFFLEGMYKTSLINGAIYISIFWAEELFIAKTESMLSFALLAFSAIFCKMYPGIMMGYYTLKTTKMVDLIKSLKNWNVPYYIIIPLSVMFRFFFSLSHDYGEIKKAKKLQNIGLRTIFKKPVESLEYTIVPLAMCSLKAADDVSISAMSRGLRPGLTRSSISDAKLKYYDYILMASMLLLIVVYIWSAYVRS